MLARNRRIQLSLLAPQIEFNRRTIMGRDWLTHIRHTAGGQPKRNRRRR